MSEKVDDVEVGARERASDASSIDTDKFIDLTLWQSLKKWRRVSLYCLAMTFSILMYGYDYVIVGTVSAMPSFQKDFGRELNGQLIIPSLWLGLWTFASPGCSMVGSIFAGSFQDWFGRRTALAAGAFLSAAGVAICYTSNLSDDINTRRGIFLAGKGFQGGAIGMVMATTQTYMSEILPPQLRGPLLALFSICTLLGQLIGAVVIYACLNLDNGYTIAFATQWPFSALPLLMAFVIPESPTYLIRKDRHQNAYRAQARLTPKDTSTQVEIDLIQRNIDHERQFASATYIDCFRNLNLRRTLIIMFANILPQIFGITLMAKASYFLQVIGMDPDTSVLVLILGLVFGVLATLVSVWVLSQVGRRRLIMTSLGVLTILWTTTGVAGCFNGNSAIWYTAISMILIIMVASLGVWPASYAVGAETSAVHLRAKAQGVGWFTSSALNSIFGFALPYIFNPDEGNLKGKTGFMYAALCAVGFVVAFMHVPEMKGRTAAEINRMFELKLPASNFRKWSAHTGTVSS